VPREHPDQVQPKLPGHVGQHGGAVLHLDFEEIVREYFLDDAFDLNPFNLSGHPLQREAE